MYCKNCGAKLEENAIFCSNCGNKITQSSQEVAPAVKNPPSNPLNDVDIAMSYASKAEENYRDVFSEQRKINELTGLKYEYETNMKASNKYIPYYLGIVKRIKAKIALASTDKKISKLIGVNSIGGIRSIILSSLIFNVGINWTVVDLIVAIFSSGNKTVSVKAWTEFIITFAVFALITVLYIFQRKKSSNKIESAISEAKINLDKSLEFYYDKTCRYITEYNNKYGVIYPKYLNTYALEYMRETLVSKRAENLKEAINLFELYDQQQKIIRENDKRYNDLLQQQQEIIRNQENMRKQYNKNSTLDAIGNAFMFAALMSK